MNYPRHAAPEAFWNRHTKVILKPRQLQSMGQVHFAWVEGETIDPGGNPPIWCNDVGGFLKDTPDWTHGRLIHYQSRSLEHYVKRDRNLEDQRRHPDDPLHKITRDPSSCRLPFAFHPKYLWNFAAVLKDASAAQVASVKALSATVSDQTMQQVARVYQNESLRESGEEGRSLKNLPTDKADLLHRLGVRDWGFMDDGLDTAFFHL